MPTQKFVQSSLLVLEESALVLSPGWAEPAVGSSVNRIGDVAFLAMQVKNIAEKAWGEEGVYAAKAIVSEGGSLYESLAAGNTKHKPSTDAGVHWKLLTATPKAVAVLGPQYRPAETTVTPDGKFSVAVTGVITSALTEGEMEAAAASYIPLQLTYEVPLAAEAP